ncbi:MAG: c-type cytochrome [Candidatus Sedimenticola sp. (ex Thyasira tokunagai)]
MLKLKSFVTVAAVAVFSMAATGSAVAADGAALYKTKTCWACHGKDANTPIMPAYPKLAGQSAGYALNQMKDIKSGTRSNGGTAAMKGVMGLVSEEEMKVIADWLSTL